MDVFALAGFVVACLVADELIAGLVARQVAGLLLELVEVGGGVGTGRVGCSRWMTLRA